VLLGVCLDQTLRSSLGIAPAGVCPVDPSTSLAKPGLVFQPLNVQTVVRSTGQICRDLGTELPGGDESVKDTSAGSNAVSILENEIAGTTPPLCAGGLSLDGAVSFVNPRLVSVETDGALDFQDYLGLTGDLQP
jgi:hypothetical protein